MMCARCVSAVRTEMKSAFAISWFVCPSARSRSTSRSRSESGSCLRPPPLLGLRGDQPRAERRMDVAPAGRDRADGADDLGVGRLLEHVAGRARRRTPRARSAGRPASRARAPSRAGTACSTAGVPSMPLLPGIITSIRTTSGLPRDRLEHGVARRSPASPTTSMSGSASSTRRSPARTTAWSSTIRTRIVTRTTRHLGDERRPGARATTRPGSRPPTSSTRSRMPSSPSAVRASLGRVEPAAVVLDDDHRRRRLCARAGC